MPLCEAAELAGISYALAHYRLRAGWPAERIFSEPVAWRGQKNRETTFREQIVTSHDK